MLPESFAARRPGKGANRMQPITTSKLLLATASLVFFAAGCGSSGGGSTTTTTSASATATWASGVCSSITTWQAAITSAAASVASNPTKDGLQTAAADAKSATETLSSDLKGLGKPGTEAGQQAADSLDQLSTDLEQGAATIGSTVDGVSSVSDALGAAPTVASTLETMQTQIKTTIEDIQGLDAKGELKNAFASSTACDSLTSGTS
jgi:uncharacterized protein YoxC